MENIFLKTIRSFVRRQGRTTKAQQSALDRLLPIYGLTIDTLDVFLQQNKPLIIEIGFGSGHSLAIMAENEPENIFLGIEVYIAGIGQLLCSIEEKKLTNLFVMEGDALDIFKKLPDNCLSGLQIYFPDPWPKKKHYKRRLIQKTNLDILIPKLKSNAWLHLATDWQPYAVVMQEVCETYPLLKAQEKGCIPRPIRRPLTRFEARGERLGHSVCDLLYYRV